MVTVLCVSLVVALAAP
ncbi:hypothetical protein P0F01_003283 [Vibrio metschnikovii]|nr:hypothetical protein [Vibrio metschnikovii]